MTVTIRSNNRGDDILGLLEIIAGNTALFDGSTINEKVNFCHVSIEHEGLCIVAGVFAVIGKKYENIMWIHEAFSNEVQDILIK